MSRDFSRWFYYTFVKCRKNYRVWHYEMNYGRLWDAIFYYAISWFFRIWTSNFYPLSFCPFKAHFHSHHLLPWVAAISSMIGVLANNNILRTLLWSSTSSCEKTCEHNLHKINKIIIHFTKLFTQILTNFILIFFFL